MRPDLTPRPADQLRFYSFVAGLYLSPLQCGLQTAHAVSEMYMDNKHLIEEHNLYFEWARHDKTIIILNALNSKGVRDVYRKLMDLTAPVGRFPITMFCEDEESLGGAATAAGIIVPRKYYDVEFVGSNVLAPAGSVAAGARYKHTTEQGTIEYCEGGTEFELVHLLKSFRLV